MAEHVPPTEAELDFCLQCLGAIDHHTVMRFAREIRRLRALCGEAAPNIHFPDERWFIGPNYTEAIEWLQGLQKRLRSASEGK